MSAVLSLDAYPEPSASRSLTELPQGVSARVFAVVPTGPGVTSEVAHRLAELGFLPGEYVRILARGPFRGEPIAVRVGTSTFALRRQEADCIRIEPLE